MNVVPFSRARFSPTDISHFNEVALPRLADGRWTAIARSSGPWGDRIDITVAERSTATFTFERDKDGGYSLYFHDRSGAVRIGGGSSAADCLWIWSSAPSRRVRSRGAA